MKKKPLLLIITGCLLMGYTLLTRHFFETPPDLADFIKGLGVGIILASLLVQRKLMKKQNSNDVA